MAAPKGNLFWLQRIRDGRPKVFESPADMWQAAVEYIILCEENPDYKYETLKQPIKEIDLVTGDLITTYTIAIPVKTAPTISGFCLFIGSNTDFFRNFKNRVKRKETLNHEGFLPVLRAIQDAIYTNQITGGLNGLLNPVLVARIQGIVDKQETKTKLKITEDINYDMLDDETLEKIIKAKK